MKTKAAVAGVLAAVALLAGCTTEKSDLTKAQEAGMTDAQALSCQELQKGYRYALDPQAQLELARKVNRWAQNDEDLRIPGQRLAQAAGTPNWVFTSNNFAQECLDLGWPQRDEG